MPTLLCIDDVPQGLALRKLVLEEKGYEVLTASDGPTGITIARQDPIDAVILDYKMPGMMGDEVAEILKRERPNVPIVLLTGVDSGLPDMLLRMIDAYVGKGQDAAVLLNAIEQVLRHNKAKPMRRVVPHQRSRAS